MEINWTPAKDKYLRRFLFRSIYHTPEMEEEIGSWFDKSFVHSEISLIASMVRGTLDDDMTPLPCPWEHQSDLEHDIETAKHELAKTDPSRTYLNFPFTLVQSVRLTWDEVCDIGRQEVSDILGWNQESIQEGSEPGEVTFTGRQVYRVYRIYIRKNYPHNISEQFGLRFHPDHPIG